MSKQCNLNETCCCGAKLVFSEIVPSNAWRHEHMCYDMQRRFQRKHEACTAVTDMQSSDSQSEDKVNNKASSNEEVID